MKLRITKDHVLAMLAVPALVLSVGSAPVFAVEGLSVKNGASSARGNDQGECLFGTETGCEGKTAIFQTIRRRRVIRPPCRMRRTRSSIRLLVLLWHFSLTLRLTLCLQALHQIIQQANSLIYDISVPDGSAYIFMAM